MSATVVNFFRFKGFAGRDWTQQELSEFYRVEGALLQGNLPVITDRGLTDEGDPWFVFCRQDTGEVIAHFARIDNHYVVISSAFSGTARGRDFRLLIEELVSAHPLMLPRSTGQNQNVFVHPAALLVALVASSFLASEKEAHAQKGLPELPVKEAGWLAALNDFANLAAVAIAALWIDHQFDSAFKSFQPDDDNALLQDNNSNADGSAHIVSSSTVADRPQGIVASLAEDLTHKAIDDSTSNPESTDLNDRIEFPTKDLKINVGHLTIPGNLGDKFQDATSATIAASSGNDKHQDVLSLSEVDVSQVLKVPASDPSLIDGSHLIAIRSIDGSGQTPPPGSGSLVPNEAYKMVVADVGHSQNLPLVISDTILPIAPSIEQAMTHVGYADGMIQTLITSEPSAASPAEITVSQGNPLAATANDLLESFIQQMLHYEIDVVGKNILVVDTNISDSSNHNFGLQTWSMADGSTLTLIGIIPHHLAAGTISHAG